MRVGIAQFFRLLLWLPLHEERVHGNRLDVTPFPVFCGVHRYVGVLKKHAACFWVGGKTRGHGLFCSVCFSF